MSNMNIYWYDTTKIDDEPITLFGSISGLPRALFSPQPEEDNTWKLQYVYVEALGLSANDQVAALSYMLLEVGDRRLPASMAVLSRGGVYLGVSVRNLDEFPIKVIPVHPALKIKREPVVVRVTLQVQPEAVDDDEPR